MFWFLWSRCCVECLARVINSSPLHGEQNNFFVMQDILVSISKIKCQMLSNSASLSLKSKVNLRFNIFEEFALNNNTQFVVSKEYSNLTRKTEIFFFINNCEENSLTRKSELNNARKFTTSLEGEREKILEKTHFFRIMGLARSPP